MKTKIPSWLIAVLLVLCLAGIGALVFFTIRKRQRSNELYDAVKAAIREDIGVEDSAESQVQKALLNARCDGKYDATQDAQTLMDAKGSWSFTGVKADDDEAIFGVLRAKTANQIGCLDKALNAQHGVSLREYIQDVFGDYWDSENLDKANRIIQTALG